MSTAHLIVTLVAIGANTFSGIAAITRFEPIMRVLTPAMQTAGVPLTWLVFPIGTLKLAGAAGLAIGLLGAPIVGTAAAAGLVLYFVCAAYSHIRVGDYSPTFFGAVGVFLPLAVASLALDG
ncbi:DoxX family protein [Nocardia sp. BMG111209]|uniref:DoxX family protein n=1 Tax=Nocardia sp. BMG111209 TaxID=1160137 RepID=UPI000380ACF2|nr:DoxX family protein [Nocardia sp. BMG111209]